jgi:hypothetical protein
MIASEQAWLLRPSLLIAQKSLPRSAMPLVCSSFSTTIMTAWWALFWLTPWPKMAGSSRP